MHDLFLQRLRILYTKTLDVLEQIPKTAAYRKYTEQITNEKLDMVKAVSSWLDFVFLNSWHPMQHLSEKFSCFFCVYRAHFLLLLFSFHTFIHPLFLSFNRLLFAEYFYMQDAVKYWSERIRSSICSLSYHCSYFFYLSSLSQSFIGLLLFICRYINLYLSSLVLE